MPTGPDALFDRLQDPAEVVALFGTSEDTILDCKQWRGSEGDKRAMLAKAVSGFANGDGGVIVIGLVAESRGKDDPDLIRGAAYVAAPEEVKAKALSYIQADVEPMIQSLRIAGVPLAKDGSGVVLILVPSQDGLPVRSKQDWKFYLRSGSSTQNMPLTVLADRFGRRPHAELTASVSEPRIEGLFGYTVQWARQIDVFVENTGRGLARFPALLVFANSTFIPHSSPFDPIPAYLWPKSDADARWSSFRGGAEAVVYPGEKVLVCRVVQRPENAGEAVLVFPEAHIHLGALCDGSAIKEIELNYPQATHRLIA